MPRHASWPYWLGASVPYALCVIVVAASIAFNWWDARRLERDRAARRIADAQARVELLARGEVWASKTSDLCEPCGQPLDGDPDPWGRPYRATWTPKGIEFRSLGPDGRRSTDDLVSCRAQKGGATCVAQ